MGANSSDKKFKVGDVVRIVRLIRGHHRYERYIGQTFEVMGVDDDGVDLDIDNRNGESITYWLFDEVELARKGRVAKPKPMKFALQYELDEDPTEYFATLPEVKKRIKELSQNSSLKRDRIYIHTLAKTQKVELGVSISIKHV